MLKLILGLVGGWLAHSEKSKEQYVSGERLAWALYELSLATATLEANRKLLAAKQRALYRGQTIEDILDPDWINKPRKGI